MAKSNRDRVEDIMLALREGLAFYVLREYKMVYKSDFAREIDAALTTGAYELPREAFRDEDMLKAAIDVAGWLNLIWRRWNDVFGQKLGHVERSYVSELITARNDWAHQRAFTNEDAYRVADTASRLLRAISAPAQATEVEEIGKELLRLRYEREAEKSKKDTGPLATETAEGLKPWRHVVKPHPDVASGRYLQAEFMADLGQVLEQRADPEYQDPKEFFRRTYLTEGLLAMLVTGLRRLCGEGGDPVVQLQTSFGGGKTHSMLALYHLVSGELKLSDIAGGDRIAAQVGEIDLPEANRAVLAGTALDPNVPHQHPDATTRTLWGEMAYQLGGLEGYQMLESADLSGASPGSNTILKLLDRFGPCLIIIDELVAYARNIYGKTDLPAGTFDSIMTFIQALTEGVRRSTDSMLLVSIPESVIEVGGEHGKLTLEELSKVVGRVEAVWKPVTATESFEIVRRRLFAEEIDYPARDAVLSAFAAMYRDNKNEFPAGAGEQDYLDRMRSAYPIHPELFDRLYEDWSTLERFQRTRGVLRLMAAVIHELWSNNDQSLLIMPGTLPMDTAPVRNEMLRYLPEVWPAVVDADVDGPESRPYLLDRSVPTLGRYAASRRVARAIFTGSAPSVAEQQVRGVEEVRVRMATVQPGEHAAVFSDALKRMSNQLTYLYSDGSRYWYDTRPTVNRLAKDRAQNIAAADVEVEIKRRLDRVEGAKQFPAAHIAPLSSADVADEQRARVVVLHPDDAHKRRQNDSPAIEAVQDIFENRGNSPRLHRNMLVFIAPDAGGAEALKEATRDYLAWSSISDEEEQLNLDAQQRKQVQVSLEEIDETVDLRIREAYNWLIVPYQPEPLGAIEWQASRISGQDSFYDRAMRKLRQSAYLVEAWSPDILRMELDKHLWRDRDHVGLKQLWEYLSNYCYLPRLRDHEVLLAAVRDGIARADAPFAYATQVTSEGYYNGLTYKRGGSVYFDDSSVLLRPEVAQRQIDADEAKQQAEKPPVGPTGGTKSGGDDEGDEGGDPPEPKKPTRYHGSVIIDPQRANRDVAVIVDEVLQHLTALAGCEVEITLEISAKYPDGFDEGTVRTVGENSRTLKFRQHGFEER